MQYPTQTDTICPVKNDLLLNYFTKIPVCDSRSLHREEKYHRYTCCKHHNATHANPDTCHISHNAMCNCLEQLRPNKKNTNMHPHILNKNSSQADPLMVLLHSHRVAHIFLPTHHAKALYIHQYCESYK